MTAAALFAVLFSASAAATCGTKGGPGYRGPNGKCVSWSALGRVCGSPPTTRCAAEATASGADEAAGHRERIEQLRMLAAPPKATVQPNPQK